MRSKHKIANVNIFIGSILLFLIAIFNPISWVYFFDSDGFLLLSKKIIFLSFDVLWLLSFYYFFKNRTIENYYKSFFSILTLNIIILLFLLSLLQIIFGNWLFNNPWFNKSIIISNKLIKYKVDNLYEADYEYINYTRDQYGLRGDYAAIDNINIMTLGGSTTDQRYISDSLTFQQILKKQFLLNGTDISIVNAGIDGQSTIGHLNNFHNWFPYINNLKVDYFLFFIGINDFHILGSKANSLINADLVNIKNRDTKIGKFKQLFYKNIIYQLLNLLDGIYYARKEGLYHGGHKKMLNSTDYVNKGMLSDYENLMEKDLIAYENRLLELNEKVRDMGSKIIFVSQSRKIYRKESNQILGINYFGKYKNLDFNGVDYYYMIQLMHQRVEKVSQQVGAIFIDLDSELVFDYNKDLYDDMHTTPSGSEKIGKYLFKKLKNLKF